MNIYCTFCIITTPYHRFARISAMYSAFCSARVARKRSTSSLSDVSKSALYINAAAPTPAATACFQGSARRKQTTLRQYLDRAARDSRVRRRRRVASARHPTLDRRVRRGDATREGSDARENGGSLRRPFANAAQPTPETAPNTAVRAVAPMTMPPVAF